MSTIEDQIRSIADEAFAQTEPIHRARQDDDRAVVLDITSIATEVSTRADRRSPFLSVAAALLLVVLVGGLLVATHQGSDSDSADRSAGLSITDSLRRIPGDVRDFGDLRIAGADLTLLETLTDVARPRVFDSDSDWFDLAYGDFVPDDTAVRVAIPRSQLFTEGLTDPDGFAVELPFSPLDVGRYTTVEMGGLTRSFDQFTLVAGLDSVQAAVDETGYLKLGTGAVGERDVASRTPLRPLGEPMQVGFDPANSTVVVDRGVDIVPAWLNGADRSLLDTSPDIAAVAEQLDRFDDPTTFGISTGDFTVGAAVDFSTNDVIDRRFTSLGTATFGVGDSTSVVYVYAFADEQAAADATPSVEAAFAADNIVPTFDQTNTPRPVGTNQMTVRTILDVESIDAVGRTVVVRADRLEPGDEWDEFRFVPPFLFHS